MSFLQKNNITFLFASCITLLSLTLANTARGSDDWTIGITPQVLWMQYNDSVQRNTLLSYGLSAKADYLEKASLTVAYNITSVEGKTSYPDIDESAWYLSGRLVRYSDFMVGKLGLRVDGYSITDKTKFFEPGDGAGNMGHGQSGNSTTYTDDVRAYYVQLDYTNYAERFYADFGYAYSDFQYQLNTPPYQNNTVQQFTTAAGMAMNNRYDWVITRIYFIGLEHSENTGGIRNTASVEFKWLHWFKPNALFNVHSSLLKILAGKRLFAVDPDAAAAYSIADMQTSSVAGGLDWEIGEQSKLFILLGYDRYEDPRINNEYSARYVFSSVSINW